MLRLLLLPLVCAVFLSGGECQTWSSGSPRDRATIYVCSGQTLPLPWNFTLQDGQRVNDVKWYHHDKLIAIFSEGTFFPLMNRVRHLTSGVLEIEHLTSSDSGTYIIEVEIHNEDGSFSSFRRSAVVKIGGNLMTDDGQLHVTQDPKTVLDPVSNLWSVALLCGRFLYDNPPFQVEWVTESGSVHTSNDYTNGSFRLLLSGLLEGGEYTCRVPQHHAAIACVHGNRTGEASLKVDDRELRLILVEAGQAALLSENNKLKEESRRLHQQIQDLQEAEHSLNATLHQQVQDLQETDRSLNITLHQQVQGLQEADHSLGQQVQDLQEADHSLGQQVQDLQEADYSLNTTLSQQIEGLWEHDHSLTVDVYHLNSSFVQHLRTQEEIAASVDVSFYARPKSSLSCSSGHVIQFTQVTTNRGQHYNRSSGVFTAPQPATYVFLVTVGSGSSSRAADVRMVVDGVHFARAYASQPDPSAQMGSSHMVVYLTKGQRVWIQCNGSNRYLWSEGTSFSGFLLRPDL